MRPTDTIKAAFTLPFRALGTGAAFLIKGRLLSQQTGAKLAKPREYRSWLANHHTGLLMDGQALSLSEAESFQNVCVVARVGAGKTSRFIIPNSARANMSCARCKR